ncbi:FMN-binding protein [Streptomyces violaceusniger]|uniref:FMN-binding domain protein n=1 Tax=Streptomyces violaceusniger (strain Tu 4113) TaxID=653045 RepID=G2P5V3_STRV4|nr:FMN-binding protein [Streptomyces violaceusniger]AEM85281.1 FMN-binding domain protein [Streptomyces violaceusniger Tu 4113]
MRKAAVTAVSTVAGIVLLLSLKPHRDAATAMETPPPSGASEASSPSPGTGPSGASSPAPTGHTSSGGATGSYTGDVSDTAYGPVQVAVTLSHGRITAVKALRTPSDRPRSQQIASYAVPRLTQEALNAQSAHIDAVSGATYTSEGYTRSLQSALDKAGV